PIIKQDKKQAIAHELFDAQVSQPTLKFIDFVVQRNRAVHMRGICDAYLTLYREASNITLSNFTTALPVDDATLQAAQTIVQERTGRQVEQQTHIDPKIIGGFAIEFNNKMYDARISTQLAKLRKAFADNAYESKL
ncbi:MAG: ATP synthase F1 subunit delta, partial [Bacteroidales bacterium]|nr:ATP synthase F1 subunit delta [Candidatus Colimorpha onthohippi]